MLFAVCAYSHIQKDLPVQVGWRPISYLPPKQEVLIWSGGRPVVGLLLSGTQDGKDWRDFIDPRTNDRLEWPTHWMMLPGSPTDRSIQIGRASCRERVCQYV